MFGSITLFCESFAVEAASVLQPCNTIFWCNELCSRVDGIAKEGVSIVGEAVHQCLPLGKALLDGFEAGRVRREKAQCVSVVCDEIHCLLLLMERDIIVHDEELLSGAVVLQEHEQGENVLVEVLTIDSTGSGITLFLSCHLDMVEDDAVGRTERSNDGVVWRPKQRNANEARRADT